ncbi:MAG: 50S ribosomal protein L21 [Synergistes sp.]|nr:50S ribosomal protein L21 [Synergistes sp.]MBR4400983.1 50S ribosomal protein L21 [Synergistes sp.]MCR5334972.1 50S ribosomal protein L21 [Synergistes sp.]
MYAVIEQGGKQYRVAEGDKFRVEKLNAEDGASVDFDKVILLGKDDGAVIGTPYVEGAKVTAKVIESGKDDKVIVFKYRRKKNYRKFRGHRQQYTLVQIETICA